MMYLEASEQVTSHREEEAVRSCAPWNTATVYILGRTMGEKLIKQGGKDIIASLYPDLGSLNLSALERWGQIYKWSHNKHLVLMKTKEYIIYVERESERSITIYHIHVCQLIQKSKYINV